MQTSQTTTVAKSNATDAAASDLYQPNKLINADYLDIKYYDQPYTYHRRAKLSMFSSILNQHDVITKMNLKDKFTIIEKIEIACFDYSIIKATEYNIPTKWDHDLFKTIYNSTCAKIAANLSTTNTVKNTYLLPAILENTVNINDLPKMTSQELFPDKYKEVIHKLELSKNIQKTIKTSTMYKCRRCGKKECTIENRYNRSLDEGVNLTITCVACGNEWNA